MALEQAYVTAFWNDTKVQISPVIHRQVRCGQLVGKSADVVVARISMEGTKTYATWRHYTRQVRWCKSCPPEALRWEWQDDAKCRNTWPAIDMLAFSQGGHHQPAKLIAEYCEPCPVRVECAQFACQDTASIVGIWGGVFIPTTTRDRAPALVKLKGVANGILRGGEAA